MNGFSAKDVPLKGMNLIEASAGTGKTYSIAAIFLRLVLEGAPVESILAVTFTKSATAELKNRLLDFLRSAKKILEGTDKTQNGTLIGQIASQYSDNREESLKKLRRAVTNFDRSSVFTIHGFCSRIVRENAFESGARFNLELSKENSEPVEQAVIDFWRKYSGYMDEEFINRASKEKWFSVDELIKLIKGRTLCEKPLIKPAVERTELSFERNREITSDPHALEKEFCTDALILVDRLFDEAKKNIIDRRDRTGKMSFDDLLSILESALSRNDAFSKQLVSIMEKKYHAVLIDEFQDTDPVQYSIFTKLFGTSGNPVFYIGDPKQSIYSFRNADVFAYLKVSSSQKSITKYSMEKNFRSSPMMTEAVNALFSSGKNPFIIDESEIGYKPVKPKDADCRNDLKINDIPHHGLEIRYLSALDPKYSAFTTGSRKFPEKQKIKLAPVKGIVFDDLCSKILQLVDENNGYTIEGVPVRPGDITILVIKHSEATEIKSYFERSGIPAVLTSDQSVFMSKEMQDLLIIMEAAANPIPSRIKAALLTMFFNMGPSEIIDIADDPPVFEHYLDLFSNIYRNWEEKGFLTAFSEFMNSENRYSLLAGFGERTLTNIRHLFELLHNRESVAGRSVEPLLSWVKEKMTGDEKNEDEQLRLESDENAVSIMTVHKSKGLDFKIVFIPYFIKKPGTKKSWYFHYHDKADNYRPVLSFDINDKAAADLSRIETMSENLRLLYVAMTRAKFLTVIYWGNINSTGSAPLSKILFNVCDDDVFKNMTDSELMKKVNDLEEKSGGAIKVDTDLSGNGKALKKEYGKTPLIPARKMKKGINMEWAVTSFSAISSSKQSEHISNVISHSEEAVKNNISLFPAGASAGTVLHSIFENIDFSSSDNRDVISSILDSNYMRYHSSEADMLPWVERCVENVLNAPVFDGSSLKNVKKNSMVSELEFFLPSKKFAYREIRDILGDAVNIEGGSISGFIHGFIDLVFRHNGKYYIVDWKSNKLGNDYSCYDDDEIKKEMVRHNYVLQYMLYLAAFDTYISKTDKNYSYESDFGGIRYIFLRGVTPENGYVTGIYKDLPHIDTVRKLQSLFR
ncbi:MAG TPA: UvrD-helicase domain-containing protein [bacterium]|nr:UvrD-helicase domain-containing protein [bacterium]